MDSLRTYFAIVTLILLAGSLNLVAVTQDNSTINLVDQKALQEARTNLTNSTKNLETVENEIQSLKRLEKDHLLLVSDIAEQVKKHGADVKSKARDKFLFQAEKMRTDVTRQLSEIQSRFSPLEKEKTSWTERVKKYEVLVSELEEKLQAKGESLGVDSSTTAVPSVNSDSAPAE